MQEILLKGKALKRLQSPSFILPFIPSLSSECKSDNHINKGSQMKPSADCTNHMQKASTLICDITNTSFLGLGIALPGRISGVQSDEPDLSFMARKSNCW
ncbi:unnamed protein product [Larinioides sclopetarius]|uniref:Uncharacterized protein n=1 Tax=Larinioides sclopetarius TaxID=280406 RepID=A0AAV2B2J3_9ARAC